MKKLVLSLFLIFSLALHSQQKKYVTVEETHNVMGSNFEIVIVAESETDAMTHIAEVVQELNRIEKNLNSKEQFSETFLINSNAGKQPVIVSKELFHLIKRCINLSEKTEGSFDITIGTAEQLWKFDGGLQKIPTKDEIAKAIETIGFQNIILNENELSVFLKNENTSISFLHIWKGFAADKARELMQSKKVFAGAIRCQGDIATWGQQASGEKWVFGMPNPLDKKEVITWLPFSDLSVATLDYYRKYITINGKKYSLILDPKTGYPTTGIQRVSVFSKSAELCDTLLTTVFVMGVEKSLALINSLENTEVVITDALDNVHKSAGINWD